VTNSIMTSSKVSNGSMFTTRAEGYMSAINARNYDRYGTSVNLLPNSFDGPEQLQFLKTYCSFNPNKIFLFGVITLFEELGKK